MTYNTRNSASVSSWWNLDRSRRSPIRAQIWLEGEYISNEASENKLTFGFVWFPSPRLEGEVIPLLSTRLKGLFNSTSSSSFLVHLLENLTNKLDWTIEPSPSRVKRGPSLRSNTPVLLSTVVRRTWPALTSLQDSKNGSLLAVCSGSPAVLGLRSTIFNYNYTRNTAALREINLQQKYTNIVSLFLNLRPSKLTVCEVWRTYVPPAPCVTFTLGGSVNLNKFDFCFRC